MRKGKDARDTWHTASKVALNIGKDRGRAKIFPLRKWYCCLHAGPTAKASCSGRVTTWMHANGLQLNWDYRRDNDSMLRNRPRWQPILMESLLICLVCRDVILRFMYRFMKLCIPATLRLAILLLKRHVESRNQWVSQIVKHGNWELWVCTRTMKELEARVYIEFYENQVVGQSSFDRYVYWYKFPREGHL